jgi:hypothetical protein
VWRLKGHARSAFWRWIANWGALVRSPSDLGYDDGAYALPPLVYHEHLIPTPQDEVFAQGLLFAKEAEGLMDRRRARKASLSKRAEACAHVVNGEKNEPWIVWCELNAEADALAEAIPDALEIRGTDTIEAKEDKLLRFARGQTRVLLTKPRIAGWGMNFQHAARMAFVGVNDSWESYYQAVRREWRFGQKRDVHVHIFASEAEGSVVKNLRRKEESAQEMARDLSAETSVVVREQVHGLKRETNVYKRPSMKMPKWLVTHE